MSLVSDYKTVKAVKVASANLSSVTAAVNELIARATVVLISQGSSDNPLSRELRALLEMLRSYDDRRKMVTISHEEYPLFCSQEVDSDG